MSLSTEDQRPCMRPIPLISNTHATRAGFITLSLTVTMIVLFSVCGALHQTLAIDNGKFNNT